MNFVDILRHSRVNVGTPFLEFLLQYKRDDEILHVFFEGIEDECFYANFLNNKLPETWSYIPYNCSGKKFVYDIHRRINWKAYSSNKVLFFVDKDLSDILPETYPSADNIFVTEFYSVENYITTDYMIRRVFRELCGFTDESRIQAIIEQF